MERHLPHLRSPPGSSTPKHPLARVRAALVRSGSAAALCLCWQGSAALGGDSGGRAGLGAAHLGPLLGGELQHLKEDQQ